jgi:threonine synthase
MTAHIMANTFVTHLEGAIDGERLPAGTLQTTYKDRPIWVRYDLPAIKTRVDRDALVRRTPNDIWRWRELLPVTKDESIVTLGEHTTPLLRAPRLGSRLGLANVYVKDDSHLPTGSFKSRGQALAISMAKELGVTRLAIPTAGNAGGAMAAYAARAGMEAYVFMPADTPRVNQFEAVLAGARAFVVDGFITDCGKIVRAGKEPMGWFDVSTLREPYRIEGKKTMGLELAEQFNWNLPDVILYPTGGGTGLIGMWKAFNELLQLGWLQTARLPRMVAVQSDGCAPIVNAYHKGDRFAEPVKDPSTIASGIRVPAAVGDFMILDAVRESGGTAIAVPEARLPEWLKLGVSSEGISFCPESAACIGAAEMLARNGWLKRDDRVVIYNCGAAQKYAHVPVGELPLIRKDQPIDWSVIRSASRSG